MEQFSIDRDRRTITVDSPLSCGQCKEQIKNHDTAYYCTIQKKTFCKKCTRSYRGYLTVRRCIDHDHNHWMADVVEIKKENADTKRSKS